MQLRSGRYQITLPINRSKQEGPSMRNLLNHKLVPLLVAVLFVCGVQSYAEEAKTGLAIVHPQADDPKAFIRNNHCVIGVWVLQKSTDEGWVGELHYPVRNDSPEIRYMVDGVKVLRPASKGATKVLTEGQFQSLMLAESKKQKGFYEVVGYSAPEPPMNTKRWLPIARGLDLSKEFFHSREYRAKDLLPSQIAQLKSDDPRQAAKAAMVLRDIGEDARVAIPDLIAHLANEDVAGAAMLGIAEIGGPESKKAIPQIVAALNKPKLRSPAIRALAKFGREAKAGAPGMLKALAKANQQNAPSINYIIDALGEVAPNDPEVRKALRTYLKHQYETTQNAAAQALAKGSD